MALADNKRGFWPIDENVKTVDFPVAASQTITRGDAVILSSGQVAIAVAGSARILGVIGRTATTLAAGTMVPVYVAGAATEFMGRQDGSDTLAIGDELDLIGATGVMQIDSDASTTDVFRLTREVDTGEADGAGKRWVFIVNKPELAAID